MKILSLMIAAVMGMGSFTVFASEELPEAKIWFDRGIPKDSPDQRMESLIFMLGEDFPKYEEANLIEFDFTAKTHGDSEAKLSMSLLANKVCHDKTSVLEVTFSDGTQTKHLANNPEKLCTHRLSFQLDAKQFPTTDITAMKVIYNLEGEHQHTKVFEKTMTLKFSDFIQTALWEIYLIHQGEMRVSPFKGIRHGDLYY